MFVRIVALTFLSAIAIYWFLIRISPKDPEYYQKVLSESIELRSQKALEQEPAFQKRQGVQKDLWTQDGKRHFRIRSSDSELVIRQKKEKIEATEYLNRIQATIPNEMIIAADEGIYSYPAHQFIAKKNGSISQMQNRIEGTCIQLDLVEETLNMENPKGHISAGAFDFKAKSMNWNKDSNLLHLLDDVYITQDEGLILMAQQGAVHLEDYKPSLVVLKGSVRLIASKFQEKESYAMADALTYNPKEKTFLFSADRRVLFWQEGLALSASEVLIRQDQTIEGHGDVHFTFDLEEKNRMDAFFKQYL